MYRHIVNSAGDPDLLYVSELQIQCALAKQAYEHLIEYSRLVGGSNSRQEPCPYSPLDVISHCVGFLSAVAGISKILFPTNPKALSRGERLRNRLNLSSLPNTESRTVRNSFEHVDERIDSLAERHQNGDICLVDIDDDPPKETIVLKRLDPKSKTIEFLGQRIDIEACYREIQIVAQAL